MAERWTVALVGSDSLLGREIRDIAAGTDLPLRLMAEGEEELGRLTRVGDEPTVVSGFDAESLADARAIFLAGSAESSRRALDMAKEEPAIPMIDLTYVGEDLPSARLRAPMVEDADGAEEGSGAGIHVIAHPAAIALALFLRRVHRNDPIRRAVVQIFAPASERGAAGVEELQQQTIALLSFKGLPQKVFDTQLSFNMLARYGAEAPVPLEESEQRIERHLASLLALDGDGEGVPMPSLRLIQAPVFHGYSISAWVEFENEPDLEAVESGLVSGPVEVRGGEFEPPTNVGQAGQGGIAVGAIAPDHNAPDALWFWLVADNVRLAAENAVMVAREIL